MQYFTHSGKLTGSLSKVQMEEVFLQGWSWLFYSVLGILPPTPPPPQSPLYLVLEEPASWVAGPY